MHSFPLVAHKLTIINESHSLPSRSTVWQYVWQWLCDTMTNPILTPNSWILNSKSWLCTPKDSPTPNEISKFRIPQPPLHFILNEIRRNLPALPPFHRREFDDFDQQLNERQSAQLLTPHDSVTLQVSKVPKFQSSAKMITSSAPLLRFYHPAPSSKKERWTETAICPKKMKRSAEQRKESELTS